MSTVLHVVCRVCSFLIYKWGPFTGGSLQLRGLCSLTASRYSQQLFLLFVLFPFVGAIFSTSSMNQTQVRYNARRERTQHVGKTSLDSQYWTQHAAIACRHVRCSCILAHVAQSLKSVKLFIQHLLSFLSFSQSMKRAATFVCMIRATLFGLRVRTDTGSNQPRPQGHSRVRPDK